MNEQNNTLAILSSLSRKEFNALSRQIKEQARQRRAEARQRWEEEKQRRAEAKANGRSESSYKGQLFKKRQANDESIEEIFQHGAAIEAQMKKLKEMVMALADKRRKSSQSCVLVMNSAKNRCIKIKKARGKNGEYRNVPFIGNVTEKGIIAAFDFTLASAYSALETNPQDNG